MDLEMKAASGFVTIKLGKVRLMTHSRHTRPFVHGYNYIYIDMYFYIRIYNACVLRFSITPLHTCTKTNLCLANDDGGTTEENVAHLKLFLCGVALVHDVAVPDQRPKLI